MLGNEIKLLFANLAAKNRSIPWEQTLFNNFVDYEASILIHILRIAVQAKPLNLDIIPTPSYLINYDATGQRLSQIFLPWLGSHDKDLLAAYDKDGYHAAIWALSGERSSSSSDLLKSSRKHTLHPYLRLAMMLRDATQKLMLENIVQVKDFQDLDHQTPLKNIVIHTIKQIIAQQPNFESSPKVWGILDKFYLVLKDPYCIEILIKKSLDALNHQYEHQLDLKLSEVHKLARKLNVHALEKQVGILYDRQQICAEFLETLSEKTSKKIIKNIQNELALREHLTLIVDAGLLLYNELSQGLFQHIKSLVSSKKINQWIPLINNISCSFDCYCSGCKYALFRHELLNIARVFNLSIVKIPSVGDCTELKTLSYASKSNVSVLSHENPFAMLGVSYADSKQVIMQKVIQLIQMAPQKMAIYRQAQNLLFHPAQRFAQHYLRSIVYQQQNHHETQQVQQNSQLVLSDLQKIPFRSELFE